MKKKVLFPVLVMVISLTLGFATPVMAITSTILSVDVESTGVAGDPVVLTITESNDGTQGWYRPAWIEIEYNGITETYGYDDIIYADGGRISYLEMGESWVWEVTYYPMVTTTYTITGHGLLYGQSGEPYGDITYPGDPEEQQIVTVEIEEASGGEGLTPGFWKNHLPEWANTAYSPSDEFNAIFGVGPDITLLEAVNLGGGDADALGRHAVAALLNASHPDIDYSMTVGEVIDAVQGAYASGEYEDTKDIFEGYNETEFELYD